MLNYINGDITKIEKGVIVHQVNCQNKIGAGVSGAIIKKWPIVKSKYHHFCKKACSDKALLGLYDSVKVKDDLIVINSFSQRYYGNSAKTGIVYTDMDKLVSTIKVVYKNYSKTLPIYIPHKIGCGLAGGNWNELVSKISDLNINVIIYKN